MPLGKEASLRSTILLMRGRLLGDDPDFVKSIVQAE